MQHFIASQNLFLVNNFSLWKKVPTLLMVKLVSGLSPHGLLSLAAINNKMYVKAKLLKSGKFSRSLRSFYWYAHKRIFEGCGSLQEWECQAFLLLRVYS